MCYYSSNKSKTQDIVREFNVIFPDSEFFKPVYSTSAFTFPKMPVISNDSPGEISLYQWGLIPFWVRSIDQANTLRQRTLNSRSETISPRTRLDATFVNYDKVTQEWNKGIQADPERLVSIIKKIREEIANFKW